MCTLIPVQVRFAWCSITFVTVMLSFHGLLIPPLFIGLLYLVSMWTWDNLFIAKLCLQNNCTQPFFALYSVSHVQENFKYFYKLDGKLSCVKLLNAKEVTKSYISPCFEMSPGFRPPCRILAGGSGQVDGKVLGVQIWWCSCRCQRKWGTCGWKVPLVTLFSYLFLNFIMQLWGMGI